MPPKNENETLVTTYNL